MTPNGPMQSTEAKLFERLKELTCLYHICQIASRPETPVPKLLQEVAELLPPAWQHPEVAGARITLDGQEYATAGFRSGPHSQSAVVVISGVERGRIEVVYIEDRPRRDEGPFLVEERRLLNAAARHLAMIVARREAEQAKAELQSQLLQADRLATIGLFAAGVAHDLNQPLGNIIGFAQLARKCEGLPEPAAQDLAKIEAASLHAREILSKVLEFARPVPLQKTLLRPNRVVCDVLHLFESRCGRTGVTLRQALAAGLPDVSADATQLNQVLINLTSNALQAMPDGGTLRIETQLDGDHVLLAVEDTGVGMGAEVLDCIFEPFFSTKTPDQGTGLGLQLVRQIVTSHGGRVDVTSQPGRGTRFEVRLPAAGRAQGGQE